MPLSPAIRACRSISSLVRLERHRCLAASRRRSPIHRSPAVLPRSLAADRQTLREAWPPARDLPGCQGALMRDGRRRLPAADECRACSQPHGRSLQRLAGRPRLAQPTSRPMPAPPSASRRQVVRQARRPWPRRPQSRPVESDSTKEKRCRCRGLGDLPGTTPSTRRRQVGAWGASSSGARGIAVSPGS